METQRVITVELQIKQGEEQTVEQLEKNLLRPLIKAVADQNGVVLGLTWDATNHLL